MYVAANVLISLVVAATAISTLADVVSAYFGRLKSCNGVNTLSFRLQ